MPATAFPFRVIQRPAAGGDWTVEDAGFRTRREAAAEAVALRLRGRRAEVVDGGTAAAETECERRNRPPPWVAGAGLLMVAALVPLFLFCCLWHCARKCAADWKSARNAGATAPSMNREFRCGTYYMAQRARQASGASLPPAPACCLCGKGPVLGYCACTHPPEVEARTAALLRDPYGREREGNGPRASAPPASEAERAARRRSAETRAAAKRRYEDEQKALFTRRAEPERAEKRGSASGTGPPSRCPPARGGPASALRRRGPAWPEREALPATD